MVLGISFFTLSNVYGTDSDPSPIINDDYYRQIVDIIYYPYIDKEVEKHWGKGIAWWSEVIALEKVEAYEKSGLYAPRYVLKLKIHPYVGAHNSIGLDYITLSISWRGDIKVDNYEVIESHD